MLSFYVYILTAMSLNYSSNKNKTYIIDKRKGEGSMPKKISVFSQAEKKDKIRIRKEAYKLWADNPDNNTSVRLARIGNEVGMSTPEVRYYMIKDKWEERRNRKKDNIESKIKIEVKKIDVETQESFDKIEQILDESGLSEKYRLFIIHYAQSFNATMASLQAGFSGNTSSWHLMIDDKVKETIKKVRAVMHQELYVTGHDILNEYVKIAFADMTQFVEVKENRITLKDSSQIDGRMIQEIKQGREGITIKLHDKMKALEKLEKLFDLIPDKKLQLEEKKFDLQKSIVDKANKEGKSVTLIDDIGIN